MALLSVKYVFVSTDMTLTKPVNSKLTCKHQHIHDTCILHERAHLKHLQMTAIQFMLHIMPRSIFTRNLSS